MPTEKYEVPESGTIKDLPFILREQIYNMIMVLDFEEIDRDNALEEHYMYTDDNFPGIGAVVSEDKITILLRVFTYNDEGQITDEDPNVMMIGVPRDNIESLLDGRILN